MLDRVMKFTNFHIIIIGILAVVLGSVGTAGFLYFQNEGLMVRVGGGEGFKDVDSDVPVCRRCKKVRPCGCSNTLTTPFNSSKACASGTSSGGSSASGTSSANTLNNLVSNILPAPIAPCPRVMEPDLSKYVLKSQIPSCNKATMPDITNYMLKTECPPVADLSKYVLKSSIPKPQPVIIDNSSCQKDAGECPPCPRPRCPVVTCPAPTKCPPPAPCPRPVCPPTVVKCKSEEVNQPTVRPFLAPLNMGGFGSA
jgi:hypothetical protein